MEENRREGNNVLAGSVGGRGGSWRKGRSPEAGNGRRANARIYSALASTRPPINRGVKREGASKTLTTSIRERLLGHAAVGLGGKGEGKEHLYALNQA